MLEEQWQKWQALPAATRRGVLATLMLLDGGIGLLYGSSLLDLGIGGDLLWLSQSVEFIIGGLLLLHAVVERLTGNYRTAVITAIPLIILLVLGACFELLFRGRDDTANVIFNLTSFSFTGLYWAAAYLSIAAGLTLTYKVQRFGNFAQAEMMLFGAFVAITLMWSVPFEAGVDAVKDGELAWELLIWACVAAFFLTGLLGVLIDRLVYRRFRSKHAIPQVMMIASLGVSMVLRALLYLRYGAKMRLFVPDRDWRLVTSSFQFDTALLKFHFGLRDQIPFYEWVTVKTNGDPYLYALVYSKALLIIGVFSAVLLLLLLLNRTRLGRQMRAVADNPDLAASSGIHVERIHATSAFLSAGISGLGGVLFAMVTRVNPEVGLSILLPSFAVVVLGTMGSVRGAMIAAIIIGFVRASSEPVLVGIGNPLDRASFSAFGEIVPYIFLIGVLMVMPQGLGDALEKWTIERHRRRAERGEQASGMGPMQFTFVACSAIMLLLALSALYPDRSYPRPVLWLLLLGGVSLLGLATWWPLRGEATSGRQLSLVPAGLFDGLHAVRQGALAALDRSLSAVYRRAGALAVRMTGLLAGARASAAGSIPDGVYDAVAAPGRFWREFAPYGRESERGSWVAFAIMLLLLLWIGWSLPSVTTFSKSMQVARLVVLVSIFGLMAFSLNLHTGITGMTNFGVIFFVGLGGISVALLSVPDDRPGGHGWSPFAALLFGILLAAAAGYLLAYPTARLRMDYFAIVTISLGEVLRVSLLAEPMLAAGTPTSAVGISNYDLPLEGWWDGGASATVGGWLGLGEPAAYHLLLAALALAALLLVWLLLETMLNAPWGRVLRAIREDEEVAKHHGHDVLRNKAYSLALGAGIAGLAGGLWVWLNGAVFPEFISPVKSTFLVWAAFIVGGRANNRGMIIGAFIIVLVDLLFNAMVAAQGDTSAAFHDEAMWMEGGFAWWITDVMGIFTSDLAISEVFGDSVALGAAGFAYIKLALVGLVIVVSLQFSAKGLLPEVPSRPEDPAGGLAGEPAGATSSGTEPGGEAE
ncbi:MAG: ABC transporter permease [Candidatus Poseidoniia archaeon]|jgi:branched-chain amino acid transport system permease protein|nr:ABC transporter permease [Candidatus Poseidoniia archaeon]MDP6847119.1 ABC transporter permease [Candidatus Poseidoniia archaeon]MDP7007651.1 ABC transporter permease [Candidatus Poseidoniia archaeon]